MLFAAAVVYIVFKMLLSGMISSHLVIVSLNVFFLWLQK